MPNAKLDSTSLSNGKQCVTLSASCFVSLHLCVLKSMFTIFVTSTPLTPRFSPHWKLLLQRIMSVGTLTSQWPATSFGGCTHGSNVRSATQWQQWLKLRRLKSRADIYIPVTAIGPAGYYLFNRDSISYWIELEWHCSSVHVTWVIAHCAFS